MSWNVVVTARTIPEVGQSAVELLRKSGCQIHTPPKLGPLAAADLIPLLDSADAALASPDEFSSAVLATPQASRLKIISRWGVGYDSIDVRAATQQGIVIGFTPGLLDNAVADFAFALMLTVGRRTHEAHAAMARGEWKPLWGADIGGKTIGIIGCGRIGQAVARRARGFDMRVLGYDVMPNPAAEQLGVQFVSLEDLLAQSDFVTLHAAVTPNNRGLIGEAQLRAMKPRAYLINAARGALVDEAALARALTEGTIAGAAVDAFCIEPLPADNPLRTAPNLVLAPHQASFARETGERVSLTAAQAIVDLMNGRRPQFVVNTDVFASPALRAAMATRPQAS